MDEIAILGVQKRIDFLGRWALALFTVAVVLISWLAMRYEAGQFGIVFELGVAIMVGLVIVIGILTVAAHLLIKRLEEHKNV